MMDDTFDDIGALYGMTAEGERLTPSRLLQFLETRYWKNQVRREIVLHRDEVADMMLSAAAVKVVKFIRKADGATSSDIATEFNCTLASASIRLRKLYTKGYLNREDVGDPTGGPLYHYQCVVPL